MSGYNPIYKGLTDAKIDAIYDNLEAQRVARSINAGQAAWDLKYSYQLACTVDAALMVDYIPRRADPLITERLICPQECPVIDPRTADQKARDLDDQETAATRAADYPQF